MVCTPSANTGSTSSCPVSVCVRSSGACERPTTERGEHQSPWTTFAASELSPPSGVTLAVSRQYRCCPLEVIGAGLPPTSMRKDGSASRLARKADSSRAGTGSMTTVPSPPTRRALAFQLCEPLIEAPGAHVRLQRQHRAQRRDEVGVATEHGAEVRAHVGGGRVEHLLFVRAHARAPQQSAAERACQADHQDRRSASKSQRLRSAPDRSEPCSPSVSSAMSSSCSRTPIHRLLARRP